MFTVLFLLGYSIQVMTYTVSDFQGQILSFSSQKSGIYEVDIGLGEFTGFLVGYGDFNNDKAVDMITVSQDRQNAQIQYWVKSNGSFFQVPICNPTVCTTGNQLIQGIIPGDYNYDGLLDVLIVVQAIDGGFTNQILIQESSDQTYNSFQTSGLLTFDSDSFPSVGDFQGNHNSSFLYYSDGQRQIYQTPTSKSVQQISTTTPFSDYADPSCLSVDQPVLLTTNFSVPNFNSVIDLTGDCRADLFIVSTNADSGLQQIEFWVTANNPTTIQNRYCLSYLETLTVGISLISVNFNDVNFDGLVDMALVLADSDGTQYLAINYNMHMQQKGKNLCTYSNATYPFQPISLTNSTATIVTSMHGYVAYNYNNIGPITNSGPQGMYAPYLRFGDYLCQGFPGALLTVINPTNLTQIYSYFVENNAVSGSTLNFSPTGIYRALNLQIYPSSDQQLLSKQQSIAAAWFDYGENGYYLYIYRRLDFLANTFTIIDGVVTYSITAFYNYLSLDAFYLKALGLNGQCTPTKDQSIQCVGATYYGSTYMISVTDLSGNYGPAVGVQLSQSSYSALQLPYAYMGLSRTNNYIEYFTMGIPLLNGQTGQWTPIIPNSQLIVSPYGNNPSGWAIAVFIEPTDAILLVVIVTLIVLVILGAVIVWKHIKEKEEDKKNQETFFQMFR